MKFGWIVVFACLYGLSAFGQGEGVEPMTGNPQLMAKGLKKMRVNAGTFDSTFIYTSDTIDLPVFDEFSKSKFQVYNAGYGDPGVTFDKVYRLLDNATSNPYPNTAYFTTQPQYRYTVDVANSNVTQTLLPDSIVRIGDLSSYPVVHVPTTVYMPYAIYDTIDFPNPVDTIWMTDPDVYQDSATQFFAPVNDPGLIWLDANVYHNYSMAKDPWSLGVATFDGLDENGFPYAIGTALTDYADYLTSKPIDMSVASAADSVYFSFLYQAEGLCDAPEQSDSLILEFYDVTQGEWDWIWSTNGAATPDFQHVHIRISQAEYFQKGFQFRFKNYGSLAGSLDHFHVDYVNLRALSGYQDTIIRDFAFVYPIWTLLDTYTSVPWDHYKNNPIGKMSSSVKVMVRNSDNVPENEQDGSTEIVYNGLPEASFLLSENLLNNGELNYGPMKTYTSYHDFSTGSRYDETKPTIVDTFEFISTATHQNSNFTQNDSTFSEQRFLNYYSYDDGTAEKAYGPTGIQSMLAIQYTPYEADSLIGAMIHFVPTVNDVTDKLFLITVWGDAGGEPGSIIYQDGLFFPRQPQYQYDENVFTTYYFMDTVKVPVSGTFYIGWQQFDSDRLGVGLDLNIVNNQHTFYSVDQGLSWEQSSIEGSVMIRPIFSTAFDASLGIEENKAVEETEVIVYPNPTSGNLHINVHNAVFERAEVYDMQGSRVIESLETTVDMSQLPGGVYYVRVNGLPRMHKVVKL